jgi:hypothetical protein
MSGQLESRHYFRVGDLVRSVDGRAGTVVASWTLFATVEWTDGGREEIDQFDERIVVEKRWE